MIELYLKWKPKIVSWMSLNPTLEPIESAYAWSTSKAKSSQDACLPSIWSSHFKQRPFHRNQGSSKPSLKHPKWTQKKQVAQLCLTLHMVCNIMVKLKVCLFIPFSMFSWIQKFHVAFNELCLCIYILKQKKNSKKIQIFFLRFPNLSQKKRKIFKWKKSLDKGHWALKLLKKKKNSLN